MILAGYALALAIYIVMWIAVALAVRDITR